MRYLTVWATGLQTHFNVTLDFIGLQNEAEVTGGPAVFSAALRASLDAAGLNTTLIECCDAHDWKDLAPLLADLNHTSPFFRSVDALAVYGTFRLNFHRFDRLELDLPGHTQPQGAAFSCLRLKWADMVLI